MRTRGPADTQTERVRRVLQHVMPGASYVTVLPLSKIIGTRNAVVEAGRHDVRRVRRARAGARGDWTVQRDRVHRHAAHARDGRARRARRAESRDVIRLIVREGLAIVLPGIVLGGAIALSLEGGSLHCLFDVSPKDPSVLVSVVATLVVVAVVASWVPATRASRVDPNEALRADYDDTHRRNSTAPSHPAQSRGHRARGRRRIAVSLRDDDEGSHEPGNDAG